MKCKVSYKWIYALLYLLCLQNHPSLLREIRFYYYSFNTWVVKCQKNCCFCHLDFSEKCCQNCSKFWGVWLLTDSKKIIEDINCVGSYQLSLSVEKVWLLYLFFFPNKWDWCSSFAHCPLSQWQDSGRIGTLLTLYRCMSVKNVIWAHHIYRILLCICQLCSLGTNKNPRL